MPVKGVFGPGQHMLTRLNFLCLTHYFLPILEDAMQHKGPHISLTPERLIKRVLRLTLEEFQTWPGSLQELALSLAAEIFMVRYNPFIPATMIWKSVKTRLESERAAQAPEYFQMLSLCLKDYWQSCQRDQRFRARLIARLRTALPKQYIVSDPHSLVECSTDATDLRMELPMLVLFPENTQQIQAIIQLANEIGFAIIPRGGGSGATGGAVPASTRSVIMSMARMNNILDIDRTNRLLTTQAGVITQNAINAVAQKGMLFTVDPASKQASSLGGNVSENAGGPFAFEYGTTIDNIYSYKIVTPTGEILTVQRCQHPRHKIMPDENAVFEILDQSGTVTEQVTLSGNEVRKPGLGKDVTNKFLGGLPGIQKEGVDGVITEITFTLYPALKHFRVLCLEFFGNSMRPAAMVVRDIVGLRDIIRKEGDLVKISALEEFGTKYVQAIAYNKKSSLYEGDPISVLILQLDSDDKTALDKAVQRIVDIVTPYDQVDVFVASDTKEAEHFWHDRHQLSAIARRTSGFKINEDIVIPLAVVPEFAEFLEDLNLYYLALAYRQALQKINELEGVDVNDQFIEMEMDVATSVLKQKTTKKQLPEQEFQVQIPFFFQDVRGRYPHLQKEIEQITQEFEATRIIIANHMHAGDGNCHVNIPVNSNDPTMLHLAEEAAGKVFTEVLRLNGAVSGEHGIGITKIAFLDDEKMKALKAYKARVDPYNIFNPGKLTQRDLVVTPYTFSFNRLIQDIQKTALPGKERLVLLLRGIQTCTRCGKCKQVCPMHQPQQGMLFHPRNKNIALGSLIEALYYTQLMTGSPSPKLLAKLRDIMDHCTACGKCMAACPVKIDSAGAALTIRSYLKEKKAGGHPIKTIVLETLSRNPSQLVPIAAQAAAVGQSMQNKMIGIVPEIWKKRFENPMFKGRGPELEWKQLASKIGLKKGCIFVPQKQTEKQAVLYFPGCGAGLFYASIGLAAIDLLLRVENTVILPPAHLCCGYPLKAAGSLDTFAKIEAENAAILSNLLADAEKKGILVSHILTSCGTCRDGIQKYELARQDGQKITQLDITQYLITRLPQKLFDGKLLYHAACHAEWVGAPALKSGQQYVGGLKTILGQQPLLSPGCCGESGMGAMTSPSIYNRIRGKKSTQLASDLQEIAPEQPVLVGCPSCRIGIQRALIDLSQKKKVLHTCEFLAEHYGGKDWKKSLLKRLREARAENGIRTLTTQD